MSDLFFPSAVRGLTFTVGKTPEWSTIVQTSASRYETRLAQMQNPIWSWMLNYDYLKDFEERSGLTYTDLQNILGFYLARQGEYDSFLFPDPDDHFVGPGLTGSSPNLAAQLQVVTDGTTYYSPLQRNMGGQFYEDVTAIDALGLNVYANGTLVNNYTIVPGPLVFPGWSSAGLYLKWLAAPSTPVTAEFNFYFRVRFDMDQWALEKFVNQIWSGGGGKGGDAIKLRSVRPAPQSILAGAGGGADGQGGGGGGAGGPTEKILFATVCAPTSDAPYTAAACSAFRAKSYAGVLSKTQSGSVFSLDGHVVLSGFTLPVPQLSLLKVTEAVFAIATGPIDMPIYNFGMGGTGVVGSTLRGTFLLKTIQGGMSVPAQIAAAHAYNFAAATGNGLMADTLAGHASQGAALTVLPFIIIDYQQ